MPLNLVVNDGDWVPYLSYNAKAGRWYIRVEGQDGDVEVTNPVLAFDFANIRTGWIFFAQGSGPEKVWDPSPDVMAPKPPGTKAFKRGFEVIVHGSGNIGLREFSSTAGSTIAPILEMYAEYEKGRAANPGKAPVFACTGVKPIVGKHGTNYSPLFRLTGWVDRSRFDATGNGGAHHQPPAAKADLLTMEQCKAECAAVGISYEMLVATLKARGEVAFNSARATPIVREMVAAARASNVNGGFEMAPPPPHEDEIPF